MSPPKILDTHIHLWPSTSTTPTAHAWMKPGHFLSKRHGPSEYLSVVDESVKGFVYVETDRYLPSRLPIELEGGDGKEVDERLKAWAEQPLEEIKFLRRIVEGRYEEGDGDGNGHGKELMKGCVLWAPFHCPKGVFERYLSIAEDVAGQEMWEEKVVGFRYLLQGKAEGEVKRLVSDENWLDNITALDKGRNGKGWTFDVGVDVHRDGEEGLEAVGNMIKEIRKRSGKVRFVLNHLCKPALDNAPSQAWIAAFQNFKQDENVYMKLSGAFNEFDSTPSTVSEIITALKPYLDVVFDCFPDRVMFGSDWPVCNVGGPKGEDGNWSLWKEVVEGVLEQRGMGEEEREGIWWRVGQRAYEVEM